MLLFTNQRKIKAKITIINVYLKLCKKFNTQKKLSKIILFFLIVVETLLSEKSLKFYHFLVKIYAIFKIQT